MTYTRIYAPNASIDEGNESSGLYLTAYFRMLQRFARSGGISVRSIEPTIRDPVAQLVVEALMTEDPSNISQVAEYIKATKGSSSRMTVRERLSQLSAAGVVAKTDDSDHWRLRESFLRKCLQFFTAMPNSVWLDAEEKLSNPTSSRMGLQVVSLHPTYQKQNELEVDQTRATAHRTAYLKVRQPVVEPRGRSSGSH